MQAKSTHLRRHEESVMHQGREKAMAKKLLEAEAEKKRRASTQPTIAEALSNKRRFSFQSKVLQMVLVLFLLISGLPMLVYVKAQDFAKVLYRDNVIHDAPAEMHWSAKSGWALAEAFDAVIISHMKSKIKECRYIALSLDETTDISRDQQMSVHVYAVNEHFQRFSWFVHLHKLSGARADQLKDALLSVVATYLDMGVQQLAAKLVCIAADGASVMQGCKQGLIATLASICPYVFLMLCNFLGGPTKKLWARAWAPHGGLEK